MADISQYTDKIRHAVYGKEVRGSLADGIEAINTEVEANTKHVNDTSTDIQNFKNEINQAESIRVQDENERKSNETNRINEFDSMKNEFNSLKNNSNEATNNANNAANNANSTATNSENRTSQAINDLTNKVNEAVTNVTANQIGGTNLLPQTGYPLNLNNFESNSGKIEILNSPAAPFNQQVYCIMNDQDSERLAFWKMIDFPIMDEVHVTESCYMYIDENVVSAELFCLAFDETGNLIYAQPTAFDIKNKWFKAINTVTINDKKIKKIQFRVDNNGVTNGQKGGVYFFYPKLERGTMATDWSNGIFDYIATIDNAPNDKDCNSFTQPNSGFLWDTGLGEFKNTPLGDLAKNSAIVFEVINYGNDGRIQQEFRQTYPYNNARKWIRNYTSDANGVWSDWRPEFIGDREINSNDDFNNITNMGCYKVQNINAFTKNSPLTLDNGIDNFGLLEVYVSGVSDNHRVLQIYYPHMPNAVGHRTPVIRMSNDNSWTDWAYIGATPKDIDSLKENINNHSDQISSCKNDINLNTKQIASNSSSINDLYNWVNKNIQMEYISGATSLILFPNKAYYLDGQHVADITYMDHSALKDGEKVYFYVASGDPLAHIVFRRQGLCNQNVRVWLPQGKDFWIVGSDNGDKIFTLMKIGDAMRFLS
ncbi:pyocin knob domain-containing protein [Clostridium thermobutyricum]|uniref:pyocin knob domain-containing protein n=1 Tax=Clostridium thermobutyricum TaxID=29372 RepID=UPI0018A9CC08|nr:pyocin knob domain-containing protein [Clostridium thermobutyricum]